MSAEQVNILGTHHFGYDGQSSLVAGFAKQREGFLAQTLEIVGRRTWLIGAATEKAGTRLLHCMRRRHQLLAGLHRTRARNHNNLVSADFNPTNIDNRPMRLDLLADQLEWLGDRNYGVDPGGDLQSFDLMPAPASYRGHDGALRASGYVWLVAGLTNSFNHVFDLLFSCSIGHIDNHWRCLFLTRNVLKKQKPRFLRIAADWNRWNSFIYCRSNSPTRSTQPLLLVNQ